MVHEELKTLLKGNAEKPLAAFSDFTGAASRLGAVELQRATARQVAIFPCYQTQMYAPRVIEQIGK